jgi:hypothetical protein
MPTNRLTSVGNSTVGIANHAQKNVTSSGTKAIIIPRDIANVFLHLAQTQSNKVHKRNQPACKALVALCRGETPSNISDRVRDAAAALCTEGAEKTFHGLQKARGVGRPAQHDNFRGWTPSVEEQKKFESLVMNFGHMIPPFRMPLIKGIMHLCRGGYAYQVSNSVRLSPFTITDHWRRISYYTPEGAFHYFTLPHSVGPEDRKTLGQFHEARLAQGNLPNVTSRQSRKLDAPEQWPQMQKANSTDHFMATVESGVSTAAENTPLRTVSPEQGLLRARTPQQTLASLPSRAQSTSRLTIETSAKSQAAPLSRAVAPSRLGTQAAPVMPTEMLGEFDSAFEDALMHTPEK